MRSTGEVEKIMATLLTNGKIQRATHNIMAYRIAVADKGTFLQVKYLKSPPERLQSLCSHGSPIQSIGVWLAGHEHAIA